MAERQVKFRLVTYFDEAPNQVHPDGSTVLVERIASMGEKIELRQQDEERLDKLGALYTDEEADAIADGSYDGVDRDALTMFLGTGPNPNAQGLGGAQDTSTGPIDVKTATDQEIAEYIEDNKLPVGAVVALIPDDADLATLEKLADAESIATNSTPRKGVTDVIERRIAALNE